MPKNKIGLTFSGFEELVSKLDKLGGDLKSVTTEALEKSHGLVTPGIHKAMKKHHRTGDTEKSIVDNTKVEWEGTVASIEVGFDISSGGLPSIFLMYGTPRMKKDTTLYNSIYGSSIRRKVQEAQSEIFSKAINERMG